MLPFFLLASRDSPRAGIAQDALGSANNMLHKAAAALLQLNAECGLFLHVLHKALVAPLTEISRTHPLRDSGAEKLRPLFGTEVLTGSLGFA